MLGWYLLLMSGLCGWLVDDQPRRIDVQVETSLSKDTIQAEWLSIDSGNLRVELEEGVQSIPLQNLLSIRFPGADPTAVQTGTGLQVFLRDGSQIFPQSLVGDDQSVSMRFGQDLDLQLPTSDIDSVRFQKLTAPQQTQWEAIMDSRITGDTLVLARSPESLDTVEGMVGSIGEEVIQFEFGEQQLDAPRSRLAGVRFFNPPATIAKTLGTAIDVWGNRWNFSQAGFDPESGQIELVLAGGSSIDIPIVHMHSMDFSAGSIEYLADLTPIGQGRSAALELGIDAQILETLFGPQPYQVPKTAGPSLRFSGSGWITYRIPPEYSQLVGTLYLSPSGTRFTACRVEVRIENELVWEQELTQLSQRLDLSVPVDAEKRVRLSVTAQDDFPVGDVVVWQELRFLK